jgi:hypothetical protein
LPQSLFAAGKLRNFATGGHPTAANVTGDLDADLNFGHDVGDSAKLAEVGTGWDQLDFVGANRVELPQPQ